MWWWKMQPAGFASALLLLAAPAALAKTTPPVGIGFASHLAVIASTAKVSNVVLENRAGEVR